MNVDICSDVRVNLDGVKTVVAKVVIAQCQINFAGDDGVPFLRVKPDIKIGVFENVN